MYGSEVKAIRTDQCGTSIRYSCYLFPASDLFQVTKPTSTQTTWC